MFKDYELEDHPNHYTSLNAAILASLNGVAYYVNDKGERNTLVNGMVITIHYPDGTKKPLTDKI